MNRRSFLSRLGLGTVGIMAVPFKPIISKPPFYCYGRAKRQIHNARTTTI